MNKISNPIKYMGAYLLTVLTLSSAQPSFGSETDSRLALEALLNKTQRPHLSEVYLALDGKIPSLNPFYREIYQEQKNMNMSLQSQLYIAQAITQLEAQFPGATWAFLGRDSAVVYDAFYAFYNRIGQPHRVVRLDASGPSFIGASDKTIVKFLEGNGLDLDKIVGGHGYVMIDTTSYSKDSQSYQLMRAVYNEISDRKISTDLINTKVNFVSLNRGTIPLNSAHTAQFLIEQDQAMKTGKLTANKVLTVQIPLTYTNEWHGSFGKFVESPDRKTVAAVIDKPNTPLAKAQIMGQMIETIKTFGSDNFVGVVQQVSENSFPLKQPPPMSKQMLLLKKILGQLNNKTMSSELVANEHIQKVVARRMDSFKEISRQYFVDIPEHLNSQVNDFMHIVAMSEYISDVGSEDLAKNPILKLALSRTVETAMVENHEALFVNKDKVFLTRKADKDVSDFGLDNDDAKKIVALELALVDVFGTDVKNIVASAPKKSELINVRDRAKGIVKQAIRNLPYAVVLGLAAADYWLYYKISHLPPDSLGEGYVFLMTTLAISHAYGIVTGTESLVKIVKPDVKAAYEKIRNVLSKNGKSKTLINDFHQRQSNLPDVLGKLPSPLMSVTVKQCVQFYSR